jgi:diaminopimelate decarboxylase
MKALARQGFQPGFVRSSFRLAIADLDFEHINTPFHFISKKLAHRHFLVAQNLVNQLSSELSLSVKIAYSIKTNPASILIQIAHETGMLAEAISQLEVKHAYQCGFPLDQIILQWSW